VNASAAHFRSLRSTRAAQRAKPIAFVEQTWELAYALEKRVSFPLVDLPGFSGGEKWLPAKNETTNGEGRLSSGETPLSQVSRLSESNR
jgi:hypothetical protein